ncbi:MULTISPECIES: hypothetical protein [Flavobacterium]|uniref:hypothetical protein n=1 Tax=Flavobacterium TaxID=237 RepID=UPI001183CA73|nr:MULTISPECIES: hypothetical protein [Flavobacterium]MCR4031334.1 hypothetical protein [Flavobacterium panacis]
MAVYFNIIIPFQKFISELNDVLDKNAVHLYVEYLNDKKGFYYELIDPKSENLTFFTENDYHGFFFSSKAVEINNGNLILEKSSKKDRISFYDDALFDYCIEGKGGREDQDNLEIIKLRIISKNPDKQIAKFYNSLQNILKKTEGVNNGLMIGNYFDSKVFYYETAKNMLSDFDKKEVRYNKRD